jgi:hypothetical protein
MSTEGRTRQVQCLSPVGPVWRVVSTVAWGRFKFLITGTRGAAQPHEGVGRCRTEPCGAASTWGYLRQVVAHRCPTTCDVQDGLRPHTVRGGHTRAHTIDNSSSLVVRVLSSLSLCLQVIHNARYSCNCEYFNHDSHIDLRIL